MSQYWSGESEKNHKKTSVFQNKVQILNEISRAFSSLKRALMRQIIKLNL
jgi:hypothetical protein